MHTILIVDDEIAMLNVTKLVLRRAGFEILEAHDGQECIDVFYEHNPDVVILDDYMPGISGSEVCAKLKSDPAVSHIPVIMHTAAPKSGGDKYYQLGACTVLFKPSLPKDILEAIAMCLASKG